MSVPPWMLIAFTGSGLLTLVSPGFGLATQAMEGNGVAANFLVFSFLCGVNTLASLILLIRRGTVRRDGKRRLKYPKAAYLPCGGGLSRRYFVFFVAELASGAAFQFPTAAMIEHHIPTAASTLLGWASGFWLAMLEAKDGKRVIPLLGLLQLAGVMWALEIVRLGGPFFVTIDTGQFIRNPYLPIMIGGSILGAWMMLYMKKLRDKEEALLRPFLADGTTVSDEGQLITSKILFYTAVFPFVTCGLAFAVDGILQGFPEVRWRNLLKGLAIVTIGCLGSRLCMAANVSGLPPANGFAVTAALGLSFVWGWWLQDLPVKVPQAIGSAITLASGGLRVLFLEEIRTKARLSRGGSPARPHRRT